MNDGAPPEVRISAALLAWLAERARAAYPREACGLLLGRRDRARADVVLVTDARNLAEEPDRFDLHPADHLAAEERARAAGLAVVGVWHTHPDAPALPSERDRAAALKGWSHVIVPVGPDAAGEARSWRLERGALREEAVVRLDGPGIAGD